MLRKALRKNRELRNQVENVLLGDEAEVWEAELKKFLAKRQCWVKGKPLANAQRASRGEFPRRPDGASCGEECDGLARMGISHRPRILSRRAWRIPLVPAPCGYHSLAQSKGLKKTAQSGAVFLSPFYFSPILLQYANGTENSHHQTKRRL